MKQKEIAKRLIELQDLIEFMDNFGTGFMCMVHTYELKNIRDLLYSKLTAENKKKFDIWLSKRTEGA